MATGTLNLLDMQERLVTMYRSKIVVVGAAFIIVGLSMKMALFPLHAWLPGAYTYSPSPLVPLCQLQVQSNGLSDDKILVFSFHTKI